jgi:tetratricopeptide (TPR) repeat protein
MRLKPTDLLLALLIAAAAFAIYRPLLSEEAGFVAYDDYEVVFDPRVADTSLSGLTSVLTERVYHTWLPLYFGSLWLDHAVWGPDPVGFHLTNLLLHIVNALLVAWLVTGFTGRRDLGFVAAFLFAVHPAMTESVAWVAERKGLVAFLLATLSMLVFLRAVRSRGGRRIAWHAGGALLLLLAMLAKGTVVVVPLYLLAWVVTLGRDRGARLVDLVPYAVAGFGLAAVHYGIAREEEVATGVEGGGAGALLLTAFPVLAGYLRLLFLPAGGQSLVHDVEPVARIGVGFAVGLLVVLLFGAAVVLAWRRDRTIAFGLLVVLAGLAPFNNVLPRTTVLFAERYLYVPALGATIVMAALLARIPLPRPATAGLAVLLFGGLAFARARVWSDPVRPFADAAEKAPASWLAAMKHGDALSLNTAREGPDPVEPYRRALGLADTPFEEARSRGALAGALLTRVTKEGAEEALDVAGDAYPALAGLPRAQAMRLSADLALHRGGAFSMLGRFDEATEAYREAARNTAGAEKALPLANLSATLVRTGDLMGALDAGRGATAADPTLEEAAVAHAEAAVVAGDAAEARRALFTLVEARPGAIRGRCLLGEIELSGMRPREARKHFHAALARRPGLRRALVGLTRADLLLAQVAPSRSPSSPGPRPPRPRRRSTSRARRRSPAARRCASRWPACASGRRCGGTRRGSRTRRSECAPRPWRRRRSGCRCGAGPK